MLHDLVGLAGFVSGTLTSILLANRLRKAGLLSGVYRALSSGYHRNGAHQGQRLYTARRAVLSQIQPGKRFQILATVDLNGR